MASDSLFPDEDKKLTPEQVREMHPPDDFEVIDSMETYRASRSRFEQLLTPTARASILDILVRYADEPLTVAEICEKTDRVSKATFTRHKEPLLDFGVIEEAGKKGNAQTYRANVYHPAVQLLAMVESVLVHGTTRLLLDDRFIKSLDTDKTPEEYAIQAAETAAEKERLREKFGDE